MASGGENRTLPTEERKPTPTEKRKSSTAVDASRPSDQGNLDMLTATATWTPVDGWSKWEEKWNVIGRKRRRKVDAPKEEEGKEDKEPSICAGLKHHNLKFK